MKIGFTGSRSGLNDEQRKNIITFLDNNKEKSIEVHHGDCVGGDQDFHEICEKYDNITIYIHPPKDDKLRAFCKSNNIFVKKDYLIRNRDIVNSCSILIACPYTKIEELRSGTWSTVRYARKNNKEIHIY